MCVGHRAEGAGKGEGRATMTMLHVHTLICCCERRRALPRPPPAARPPGVAWLACAVVCVCVGIGRDEVCVVAGGGWWRGGPCDGDACLPFRLRDYKQTRSPRSSTITPYSSPTPISTTGRAVGWEGDGGVGRKPLVKCLDTHPHRSRFPSPLVLPTFSVRKGKHLTIPVFIHIHTGKP